MEIKYPAECTNPREVFSMWKTFRQEGIDCLKKTPADVLIRVPEEGRWSMSEIAEHLYITQWNIARSIPIVMSGRGDSKFKGYTKEPDYRGIKLKLMRPSGVKNPDSVSPLNKYSYEELLPLLNKAESKLEEGLYKYSKEELMTYKMDHPFFGSLHVFDFIWVMGMHENSHLYALKQHSKSF